MSLKACTRCNQTKAVGQFRRISNYRRHSWCKTCESVTSGDRARNATTAPATCSDCRGDHPKVDCYLILRPGAGGKFWLCQPCWGAMVGAAAMEAVR